MDEMNTELKKVILSEPADKMKVKFCARILMLLEIMGEMIIKFAQGDLRLENIRQIESTGLRRGGVSRVLGSPVLLKSTNNMPCWIV